LILAWFSLSGDEGWQVKSDEMATLLQTAAAAQPQYLSTLASHANIAAQIWPDKEQIHTHTHTHRHTLSVKICASLKSCISDSSTVSFTFTIKKQKV